VCGERTLLAMSNTDSTPDGAAPVVTTELRARALQIAARSGADPRTALRALIEGPHTIRRLVLRDAIVRAIDVLERENRPRLVGVP
jgi:hypothetical protein